MEARSSELLNEDLYYLGKFILIYTKFIYEYVFISGDTGFEVVEVQI